jgi:hypothetical protein
MNDIVIKPAARKQKKKGKRPDKRPARLRYWMSGRLEERKIRNLMKYCGMSKQSAYKFWHNTRKGRVKDGILHKVA